jgi:hypothetical protein
VLFANEGNPEGSFSEGRNSGVGPKAPVKVGKGQRVKFLAEMEADKVRITGRFS